MTNMEQALAAAGVKIPSQKQRIWTWLKDNGPHSVKDLYVELKIGEATVQAAVTGLIKRKMLRMIPRTDFKGMRMHNHYEALGRAYELLPLPLKRGAAGRAVANNKHPIPPEVVDTPAPKVFSPETLLANCTLAEMRQVYNFLREMFK